jgi:hypothetical protein
MSEEKSDIFIVMGHGYEDVVQFEKRTILPEGYTVVTFCECGGYTTLARMCPLYPSFVDGSYETKIRLLDPEQFKREYPQYMMHVYKPGSYIPTIKTTLKIVWNKFYREPHLPSDEMPEGQTEEEHTTVKYLCKSGVYKYPVDERYLFNKEKDEMCGNTGWCAEIPEGDDPKEYVLKSKEGSLEMKPSPYGYTLDDIMRKFGPGVYYVPICRRANCEDDEMRSKIQFTRQHSIRQQEQQEKGLLDKSVKVKAFPLRPLDRARIKSRINFLNNLKDRNMLNEEQFEELERLQKQIADDDDLKIFQQGKGKLKKRSKRKTLNKKTKHSFSNKTRKYYKNKSRKNSNSMKGRKYKSYK